MKMGIRSDGNAVGRHADGIDGLRAAACFGIVMMHVLVNGGYALPTDWLRRFVNSFTDFVYLFMVISAYGMCCGYYERIMTQRVSMEDFYRRRFSRVFPFFAFLVLLDVLLSPGKAALCEGFADLTLLFGFFAEKEITVIGVGWYLGLTFAFYLVFPFFCVLLKNKKRAWAVLLLSILLNLVCRYYFNLSRKNFAYSLCYFLAGGLLFLYRDELTRFSRKHVWTIGGIALAAIAVYLVWESNTFTTLAVSAALVIFALGRENGFLRNRFMAFISSISMEIYLSHMIVYRALEMLKLKARLGGGWLSYILMVIIVFVGAAAFSYVWGKAYAYLNTWLQRKRGRQTT